SRVARTSNRLNRTRRRQTCRWCGTITRLRYVPRKPISLAFDPQRRLMGVAHELLVDRRPFAVTTRERALGDLNSLLEVPGLRPVLRPVGEARDEFGGETVAGQHAGEADVAAGGQPGEDAGFGVVPDQGPEEPTAGGDLLAAYLDADLA